MNRTSSIFLLFLILVSTQVVEAGWEKQKTNTLAWLRTIDFVDADTGRIGGSKGTILITKDGGNTRTAAPKFTSDTIKDIRFVDADTGWALCERDIYRLGSQAPTYIMSTKDGGKSWKRSEFPDNRRRRITRIVFSTSGYGIAIGEMGTLYGLADDNLTWKKQAPPTDYLMLDAAFTDEFHGAIVGGGGLIMFTEDAGVSWQTASVSERTGSLLRSVYFANSRDGWTVGSGGRVFQTFNGGRYWRLQNSGTKADLNKVYFHNNADGWTVGKHGTILKTTTGGNVWTVSNSKSRHHLEDIEFVGETGWVVGFGGTLLKWKESRK